MVALFGDVPSATLNLAANARKWESFLPMCLVLDNPALTAVVTEAVIKTGKGMHAVHLTLDACLHARGCPDRLCIGGIPHHAKQPEQREVPVGFVPSSK